MAKKLTRKQLLKEPDEFITFTGKLIRFGRAHQRKITWILSGLVLLVFAFSGFRYLSGVNEQKASARLGELMSRYQALSGQKSPSEAYDAVKQDFEEMLETHGGKKATRLARFAYANMGYDAGDYQHAIALYNRSLADFDQSPFYRTLILDKIGHAKAEEKDIASAISSFVTVADKAGYFLQDEALFLLGNLYESGGNSEKSKAAFDRILSDHAGSAYVALTRERPAG